MKENYETELQNKAFDAGNILCFGIDPEIEKIPLEGGPEKAISKFYVDILDAAESENIRFPSVKPNIAFFEQYGFEGLRSLKKIMESAKEKDISVIMDAKRGDIGKTALAYAKSIFDFWKADAVTIAPYLGHDSVEPFLSYENKGVYVLNRTSNKSATEVQDLKVGHETVYRKVSELILKWHKPGLGSVVGATYPRELEEISGLFASSGKRVPFLIPGVGNQGGNAKEVIEILKKTNNPLWLHRVNSSSGISYAYLKDNTEDYAGAAVREMKKLVISLKI